MVRIAGASIFHLKGVDSLLSQPAIPSLASLRGNDTVRRRQKSFQQEEESSQNLHVSSFFPKLESHSLQSVLDRFVDSDDRDKRTVEVYFHKSWIFGWTEGVWKGHAGCGRR